MNLKRVFWDYDEFQDENKLLQFLKENKHNESVYLWIMSRFLEYGRVVDTLKIFSLEEIKENIDKVKISERSKKKWKRILELLK
jgi:elongation factor P--beta-lysine ligase